MKDIISAEFRYDEAQTINKVLVHFLDGEKAAYTDAETIVAVGAKMRDQLKELGAEKK